MAPKVILDTNVFISVINKEATHEASSKLLNLIDLGNISGVISTVSLAELSVGYHMEGDVNGLKTLVFHMISSSNYEIIVLDVDTAVSAGKIRAEVGLRLPDSIIVASGIKAKVDYLISDDAEFKKADKILKTLTPNDFILTLS